MLLRSIHHVLHINRSLAVRSLWQSLQDPSPGGKSSPSFFNKHSHTDTHTQNKHTHPHKLILSILNVYDNEIFSIILCLAPYSCPLSLSVPPPTLPPTFSLSLSFSLSLRCGWVGESCSSQTVHLPCSAKRPESSGRARAKGCSQRETASLHKPVKEEDGWFLGKYRSFSKLSLCPTTRPEMKGLQYIWLLVFHSSVIIFEFHDFIPCNKI